MRINEIFCSIQGESTFAGRPCVFIRSAACDLRCSWCDTEYAFYEGREMAVPEILDRIARWPARLALVTGGEPMLQQDVHELLAALLQSGYEVCLETGGHQPLEAVDPRVHKIMDLKCPSSGMSHRNRFENIGCLSSADEVKFVIADRADFEWACRQVERFSLPSRVGAVLFSPVWGRRAHAELAQWVLDSGLQIRLQLQLHRLLWPDATRGV